MSVMLTNNAKSRLASSIGISDTTIAITSGEGAAFPSPGPEDWFPLTLVKDTGAREIVRCTARVGDVFTVERAQEGTEALSFSVGDRVELRLTAEVINELAGMVATMQPGDPRLDMLTELELAANNLLYATGENSLAMSPLTAFARSLLDDDDAGAMLQTLGLDQTGVFKTGPTGAARIPVGTTVQRPSSPAEGLFRLNTTINMFEVYRGGQWSSLAEQAAIDLLVAAYEAVNERVDNLPPVRITKQYFSPVTAFTNGGLVTFNHGLGEEPKLIQLFAICKVAVSGWNVGDVIPVNMSYSGTSNSTGALTKITSTQISIRVGVSGLGVLMNFNTGSGGLSITGTNFNLKVKAYA